MTPPGAFVVVDLINAKIPPTGAFVVVD